MMYNPNKNTLFGRQIMLNAYTHTSDEGDYKNWIGSNGPVLVCFKGTGNVTSFSSGVPNTCTALFGFNDNNNSSYGLALGTNGNNGHSYIQANRFVVEVQTHTHTILGYCSSCSN